MIPTRRLTLAAALALSLVAGLVSVGSTTATFVDQEEATVKATAADIQLRVVDTYLPRTMVAIADTIETKGVGVYVWGNRDRGQSGDGNIYTNNPGAPVSEVTLPGERKFDLVVAGSSIMANLEQYSVGIAALATDGTVWTWGCRQWEKNNGDYGRRCGRAQQPDDPPTVGSSSLYQATPLQVVDFRPALASNEYIVDLKSTRSAFFALTNLGTLYGWGESQGTGVLGLGPDAEVPGITRHANTRSAFPRRILTQVHSFGTGPNNVWATVACDWKLSTWSGRSVDLADHDGVGTESQTSHTCDSSRSPSLLFWGANTADATGMLNPTARFTGGGLPAGGANDDAYITGSPVENYYYASPSKLTTDKNPLGAVFAQSYTKATEYATGSDQDVGVRMGSPGRAGNTETKETALKADHGAFRLMTGHEYGSVVIYIDRSLGQQILTWGNGTYYGGGHDNALSPTTITSTFPAGDLTVTPSRGVVFIRDSQNSLWMYGATGLSDRFPGKDDHGVWGLQQVKAGTAAVSDEVTGGYTDPVKIFDGTDSPLAPGHILSLGCGDQTCLAEDTSGAMWAFGGGYTQFDNKNFINWNVSINNNQRTVRSWFDCRNSATVGAEPIRLHVDGRTPADYPTC
jgi:hypothetical protein